MLQYENGEEKSGDLTVGIVDIETWLMEFPKVEFLQYVAINLLCTLQYAAIFGMIVT